jgi:hypothetical protein
MTIYVQAKSKKAINEALSEGKPVIGFNPSAFGSGGQYFLRKGSVPEGTVIKVYEKLVGGSPYVKAYGTWDGDKVK